MKTTIRNCDTCQKPFKTRALYTYNCDKCEANRIRQEYKQDPNSIFHWIKGEWARLEKDCLSLNIKEQEKRINQFWKDFFKMGDSFNQKWSWKRFQFYWDIFEIPVLYQLSKEQFEFFYKGKPYKPCLNCQTKFKQRSFNTKYCSSPCRKKHYAKNKKLKRKDSE
jgi:hypothetical protein